LLELADNAVDDRFAGEPLVVEIGQRRGVFTIVNTGGRGMGVSELEEFLDWGRSTKQGKLGRYGQGGKAALGYLGRSWEIRCKPRGEYGAYRIVEATGMIALWS
ncbi:MAG: ATP-binding protein, partial [Acidobacteria bacterium]|nr:ATP-binding protein [Acidobacteriota bacterium]